MVATSTESKVQSAAAAKRASTDDEKAEVAAAEEAAVQAHPHKGQFVLYTGPRKLAAAAEALKTRKPVLGEGTEARISVADWKKVGVAATRDHEWSLANNYRLAATLFTEEQLDYLRTYSKRFELVDADGNKV
ncbi:hypothetical protein EV580_1315 [Mycobacterium sp. BK086]|uniref:hypothetical protein n=1 Tax=Mycobacterium sp. BK086 TaxID=2512165 RepID=UPI00105EE884|nr:hypothetical protein [Mycobacterium sp. BK086]TDO18133.1 hypothetical protein EV580_1315 [Mycobacterium sp. BK086]